MSAYDIDSIYDYENDRSYYGFDVDDDYEDYDELDHEFYIDTEVDYGYLEDF